MKNNAFEPDTQAPVAFVSKVSVYLLNDEQFIFILQQKGVDISRKTYTLSNGAVYYVD